MKNFRGKKANGKGFKRKAVVKCLRGQHPIAALPKWIPLQEIVDLVNGGEWQWYKNTQCKYIELRVDMRDGKCLIANRDSEPITLEELKRQSRYY